MRRKRSSDWTLTVILATSACFRVRPYLSFLLRNDSLLVRLPALPQLLLYEVQLLLPCIHPCCWICALCTLSQLILAMN